MAQYNSFSQAFKQLEKNVNKAKVSALNKTMVNVRTMYAKEVAEELGVSSAVLKKRARIIRATSSNLGAVLSIAVKYLLPAHYFKPLIKKVMSKAGMRTGATIKIGKGSRDLLPNAFIATGKNSGKKIVIERKGDARYPTKTTMIDVLRAALHKIEPKLNSHAREQLNKNFNSDLKYYSSK